MSKKVSCRVNKKTCIEDPEVSAQCKWVKTKGCRTRGYGSAQGAARVDDTSSLEKKISRLEKKVKQLQIDVNALKKMKKPQYEDYEDLGEDEAFGNLEYMPDEDEEDEKYLRFLEGHLDKSPDEKVNYFGNVSVGSPSMEEEDDEEEDDEEEEDGEMDDFLAPEEEEEEGDWRAEMAKITSVMARGVDPRVRASDEELKAAFGGPDPLRAPAYVPPSPVQVKPKKRATLTFLGPAH
jgi:hypothetical protein